MSYHCNDYISIRGSLDRENYNLELAKHEIEFAKQGNHNLTTLFLDDIDWTNDTELLQDLQSLLSNNDYSSSWKVVHVSFRQPTNPNMDRAMRLLSNLHCLETLHLGFDSLLLQNEQPITESFWKSFVHYLAKKSLKNLRIQGIYVTRKCLEYWTTLFNNALQSLTSLELAHVDFRRNVDMTKWFANNSPPFLKSLKRLDLEKTKIRDVQLADIIHSLHSNKDVSSSLSSSSSSLEHFSMSLPFPDTRHTIHALTQWLPTCNTIQSFAIKNYSDRPQDTILGEYKMLLNALCCNTSLRHVNLAHMRLNDTDVAEWIVPLIIGKQASRKLQILELHHNQITNVGMKHIAHALKKENNDLIPQQIYLNHNLHVTDKGWEYLLQAIQTNNTTTITQLTCPVFPLQKSKRQVYGLSPPSCASQLEFYLYLNQVKARTILRDNNDSMIPLKLWPLYLDRVVMKQEQKNASFLNGISALFYLLKEGPILM